VLADAQARARIQARLARVALGNFGDHKPVGDGVLELRIDWGAGYRVYFARIRATVLILLCGGDKTTQQEDIARAKNYLEDFKARSASPPGTRGPHGRRRDKRGV
jgi:putative addiction module killer protein